MSDEADMAERQEEMARQSALLVRRREAPKWSGNCMNCGESIVHPLRWCDADCREDWAKREDQ